MRTVKTYLIRKPSDIKEVLDMSERYPERAEIVAITETIKLIPYLRCILIVWRLHRTVVWDILVLRRNFLEDVLILKTEN